LSDWTGVGTVAASGVAVTPTELINECQCKRDYFPTCTTVGLYTALLTEIIAKANAGARRQVGAYYASTDADVIQEVHDCILYLAASLLWQLIANVITQYDDEELPPEIASAEQAGVNRDHYRAEAESILVRYDVTPAKGAFVGAFTSGAIEDEDDLTILGLAY